jgi:hypothetical protein
MTVLLVKWIYLRAIPKSDMENIHDLHTEATSSETLPVDDKYAGLGEPPSSTENQAFREHCKKVFDYAVAERRSIKEGENLRDIHLWYDLGTSIRPSNFACLPADEISPWRNMIPNKGINIPTGRGVKTKTVIIELLTGSDYPGEIQPSNARKKEDVSYFGNTLPKIIAPVTSNQKVKQGDMKAVQAIESAAIGGGDGDAGDDGSDDQESGRCRGKTVVVGDKGIVAVTMEANMVTELMATTTVHMEEAIEDAVVRFVKTILTTAERQLTRTRCKHSARFTAQMAKKSKDLSTQF